MTTTTITATEMITTTPTIMATTPIPTPITHSAPLPWNYRRKTRTKLMSAYIRDPKEIYRRSFAIVREETALDGLPPEMAEVAIRLVHSCGMPEIVADLSWSPNLISAAKKALLAGKSIVTDVRMTEVGIIRNRLSYNNPVHCAIGDLDAATIAQERGTTRSAVAIENLASEWNGGLVVIGSAPTALFRVLELIAEGVARPAAILGLPVGFVGAAESKEALITNNLGVPYLTLRGRRGGSALAAAAVNALSGPLEH
jgi:precorrin-8X/cobalt-precorrin-8 methylmutase